MTIHDRIHQLEAYLYAGELDTEGMDELNALYKAEDVPPAQRKKIVSYSTK